jgi:predicted transcriptional regulator
MRTLIDLHDEQVQALDDLRARTNQPRAAVIRAAVDEYLARHATQPLDAAFGLWGAETPDGLTYQAAIRAEW